MPILTAATRRDIRSLENARSRRELGLFVVEGAKGVLDTIHAFDCQMILATGEWLACHDVSESCSEIYVLSPAQMERVSRQPSAPDVIAVYRLPEYSIPTDPGGDSLVVALDCVQDPGNLGTIIRLCDWMGVTDILATQDTADVFNPKVVRSTMGSIARVRVHYVDDLAAVLTRAVAQGTPVYGTFLDGTSIYDTKLSANGIIIMGNEGRGVSPSVADTVSHRLLIPSFPPDRPTAESLNVAMATGIILAEFRRRLY